jgi:protein SCO1
MLISKAVQVKVLIGLVIFFAVWLVVESVKVTKTTSQAGPYQGNSTNNIKIGEVNKITGLPEPGTYKLYKIFQAPEYKVLDTKGVLQNLNKFTKGKITLLTFFYERCSDANGCPYAMSLFHIVKSRLEKEKGSANFYRFVHISFDPDHDTPIMMAGLEKRNLSVVSKKDGVEWDFLTTASINELMPIIDGFGQNVDVSISQLTGKRSLNYSHVLKVFLIDEEGYVREIYSTSYLSAEMLLNDIKTLSLEKSN